MSLLDSILGNASEISADKVEHDLKTLLIPGENVEKVFALFRDLLIFTNKRLITIDKQGVTGHKSEVLTIPYKSIIRFSKENAGTFDRDSEFKIWLSGMHEPMVFQLKKGSDIDAIYRVISDYILNK